MNAHKFVAEKGIDKAKRVLSGAPDWACYYSTIDGEYYLIELDAVNLKQLKQVVESIEIVENHGGVNCAIEETGSYYIKPSDWEDLNQAIADYELVESYKENHHV